jgi:tripartite-type tricarboxylate transporter receptor subunit TctC
MSSALGQPVIVENRPGAAGAIGAKAVAAAAPDGHTLLVSAPAALVVVPTLYKNPGYDPAKDLVAVATAFSSPQMLVVHPTFSANSIRDIVAYAKANPGKLNYASPGYGTAPHLLGELFRITAGIDIVNVRYKGGGESVIGMLSGQTHLGFEIVPLLLGHIQAGKLKPIAVADAARSNKLPDVPTTVEAGFPDLQATTRSRNQHRLRRARRKQPHQAHNIDFVRLRAEFAIGGLIVCSWHSTAVPTVTKYVRF